MQLRHVALSFRYILIYDLLNMPHPNPELKSPTATVDDQMRNVFKRSSIAARRDLEWFATPAETERLYWLTHEVFEVTNLGRREWYTGDDHWVRLWLRRCSSSGQVMSGILQFVWPCTPFAA